MPKAQGLDDVSLNRRSLLVHSVGAERGANHGASRTAAFGLSNQLGDGFRDIMRIWSVGRFECREEVLEHGAGNFADRAVFSSARGVRRVLNIAVHWRRIRARLHQRDLDSELR